jgi:hypothetical protein
MGKMKNTGKDYEEFVRNLQQAIINSEEELNHKNIVVEKNKIIRDKNGLDREFDLYWEYELGGFTYRTVIECKDYNTPIKPEKIDALIGKIHDIPDLKPVFATKTGYQSGAEKKALQNGIDLIIVRKQNDSDWIDKDGNHLWRFVNINITSPLPAKITKIETFLDVKWIKENRPDIDITKPFYVSFSGKEAYIDDKLSGEKYTFNALSHKLNKQEEYRPGNYERILKFSDAYFINNDENLKISVIKISYCIQEPIKGRIHFDFADELLGVIEYLNKGIKKKIFDNGDIQQDQIIVEIPKNL